MQTDPKYVLVAVKSGILGKKKILNIKIPAALLVR